MASPKLSRRVEKVLPYAPLSGVKFGMFCATVLICPTRQSQTSSCMPTIEALKASGVDWTVVSPSFAMETALAVQARLLAATGAMCGCTAREPLSLVAAGDVARASVAVLDDGPAGADFELTGPEALSLEEVARSVAHATGRRIPYRELTEPELRHVLVDAGFPEQQIDFQLIVQFRAIRASRPGARRAPSRALAATGTRIVYLSGSDGRPVRDPSLRRLCSSCISAAHEVPADVACEQPPPCLADRPRRPACVAADERQRDARRHPGTRSS